MDIPNGGFIIIRKKLLVDKHIPVSGKNKKFISIKDIITSRNPIYIQKEHDQLNEKQKNSTSIH